MNEIPHFNGSHKYKKRMLWTQEEDKILVEFAKKKGDKNWSQLAQEMNSNFKTKKTGKQCRERYRNYFKPTLKTTEWSKNEKLLLPVLQKIYGNKWCYLSIFLNQRSDIAIKNQFYTLARKILKAYKAKAIPGNILDNPQKMYQFCSTLDLLIDLYVPSLFKESSKEHRLPLRKEKIIIKILKDCDVSSNSLGEYKAKLIKKFKEVNAPKKLPVQISIDLSKLGISGEKADEIIRPSSLYNTPPLSDVVIIILSPNAVPDVLEPTETPNPIGSYHLNQIPNQNTPPFMGIPGMQNPSLYFPYQRIMPCPLISYINNSHYRISPPLGPPKKKKKE
jgi:hypothetical protein